MVRRAEAEAAVAECDAALAAALARVPTWSGGADALIALVSASHRVWRRLDSDMTTKRSEVARSANGLTTNLPARSAQRALTRLTEGGTIADDAALARARSHRDVRLKLIYRRAFTADPPSAAEEQAFAADVPLPLAFERAIAEADTIAAIRRRCSCCWLR